MNQEAYNIRIMSQLIDALAKGGKVKSFGTMHMSDPPGYEYTLTVRYARPGDKEPVLTASNKQIDAMPKSSQHN